MRAELLRFTEHLRQLVGRDENNPVALREEAENLVATKIEPVVREAAHRTDELAKKKWKRFRASVMQAFGFAGAAFVYPEIIPKAVEQTLKATAIAMGKTKDEHPYPKMTAQFVLQAHRILRKK
jgi:hypothetical protein